MLSYEVGERKRKISAPIGAWECNLKEIMTDRPTERPTSQQTDMRAHSEVTLPIIIGVKKYIQTHEYIHHVKRF